jgi:hypothetical protein
MNPADDDTALRVLLDLREEYQIAISPTLLRRVFEIQRMNQYARDDALSIQQTQALVESAVGLEMKSISDSDSTLPERSR